MVGGHHRLDGHKFEQALGVGDGLGSLVCCTLWGGLGSPSTQRKGIRDQGKGFPGGLGGKQSACNAGNPGLIPGPMTGASRRFSRAVALVWGFSRGSGGS